MFSTYKTLPILLTGLILLLSLSGAQTAAYAHPAEPWLPTTALLEGPPPITPVLVHGTVKIDGQDAPVGTTVEAWINNTKCASTTVITNAGAPTYYFNVPDDSHSLVTACANGAGKVVSFKVGSMFANETLTLTSSAIYTQNLTAISGYTYFLPIIRR